RRPGTAVDRAAAGAGRGPGGGPHPRAGAGAVHGVEAPRLPAGLQARRLPRRGAPVVLLPRRARPARPAPLGRAAARGHRPRGRVVPDLRRPHRPAGGRPRLGRGGPGMTAVSLGPPPRRRAVLARRVPGLGAAPITSHVIEALGAIAGGGRAPRGRLGG